MDIITAEAIECELHLASDHTPGRTELDLVYDGTRPPEALFDAIASVGWQRPVAAPPPRSAVDWTAPDPARGTRYTVRPYRAVVHVVPGDPPAHTQPVAKVVSLARAHGVRIGPELEPEAPAQILVSTTVSPHAVATVADMVPQAALIDQQPRPFVRTTTYRGRSTDTEVPAVRLLFQVPVEVVDDVLSALAGAPLLVAPRIEPGSA
jgi:hypothetical protein